MQITHGRMQYLKHSCSFLYCKSIYYLIVHFPRFVAKMTIGAIVDSSARWRYVKHSMSSMWTSSIKRTPGTSSAIPWSMYLFTILFISFRSLSVHHNDNVHHAGWPLSRQCEIPWRFAALLRGTRHVKCHSYHARTSVTVIGGGRNAIHDPKPYT